MDRALGGSPIKRVPDLDGGWRVVADPNHRDGRVSSMAASSVLRQRRYWLSKTRNEPLTAV